MTGMPSYPLEVLRAAALLGVVGSVLLVTGWREKSPDLYRAGMTLLLVAGACAVGGLINWFCGWSR